MAPPPRLAPYPRPVTPPHLARAQCFAHERRTKGVDSTGISLHLAGCAGSIKTPSTATGKVSIHVSHILSGRCLAKIDWKSADPSNLTALCYNEVGLASPL